MIEIKCPMLGESYGWMAEEEFDERRNAFDFACRLGGREEAVRQMRSLPDGKEKQFLWNELLRTALEVL